mgnify:CR=1 FL=1
MTSIYHQVGRRIHSGLDVLMPSPFHQAYKWVMLNLRRHKEGKEGYILLEKLPKPTFIFPHPNPAYFAPLSHGCRQTSLLWRLLQHFSRACCTFDPSSCRSTGMTSMYHQESRRMRLGLDGWLHLDGAPAWICRSVPLPSGSCQSLPLSLPTQRQ